MKYIRTKDGVLSCNRNGEDFEAILTDQKGWVKKENVLKQADTIYDLCDLFIYKNKTYEDAEFIEGKIIDTIPHGQTKDKDRIYLSRKKRDYGLFNGICVFGKEEWKKIHGAIWTTGKHGEPILQSVCRFNDKGELEEIK